MTVKQFNVIKEILYLFLFNNLIPQKYKVISYIVYRMIYSQTVLAGPIYTIHRNDTCTHEEHTRCIHLISLLFVFHLISTSISKEVWLEISDLKHTNTGYINWINFLTTSPSVPPQVSSLHSFH